MASDLSVMERMFPNISIPAEYKFDFPISENITDPEGSDIDSSMLVFGSVEVTRANEVHKLTGLQANTEYQVHQIGRASCRERVCLYV